MDVKTENTSRKIDALGRISVPSGLRNRYGIEAGDELEFGTIDDDGREFIVMCKKDAVENVKRYKEAASVLQELGCFIPQELFDKLREYNITVI